MNYELLDNAPEYCESTAKLMSWSENHSFPTPGTLFLDLIGYSADQFGQNLCDSVPADKFGYLEADMLGKALTEWSQRPQDVTRFVEQLLQEVEPEENELA